MSITFTQLSAFLAVVRSGSVTAAADELVVTQPSVSSAIAALGKELGCELFERAGRGIQLTDAGKAFVPYAEDVVGVLDKGRRATREAAARSASSLQIAAVTTAAESFVPGLMREFSNAHPDIELKLVVGNNQDVLERVLTHRDDLAISGTPPGDERLVIEPMMANEIVCITFADDPVAAGGPVPASALTGRSWLLRERGSGTRSLNERFLEARGLRPRTLTLGSNGAINRWLAPGSASRCSRGRRLRMSSRRVCSRRWHSRTGRRRAPGSCRVRRRPSPPGRRAVHGPPAGGGPGGRLKQVRSRSAHGLAVLQAVRTRVGGADRDAARAVTRW